MHADIERQELPMDSCLFFHSHLSTLIYSLFRAEGECRSPEIALDRQARTDRIMSAALYIVKADFKSSSVLKGGEYLQ